MNIRLEEFLLSEKNSREFLNEFYTERDDTCYICGKTTNDNEQEDLCNNCKEKYKLKENGVSKGCVMLDLSYEKDYRIMSLRNSIPIENIYSHKPLNVYELKSESEDKYIKVGYNSEQEDLGYEEKEHCTVFYGLENDGDLFTIKKFVNDNYPRSFVLKTEKLEIFRDVENGECDCLVIKCIVPKELADINNWIRQMFQTTQTYREYIPHITLAYIRKGTCEEFLNKSIDFEFICSVKDFIYSGHDKILMEKINNNYVK